MDILKITISEDGLIKTETDAVSGPNHSTAEAFLRTVNMLAGGQTKQTRKAGHTHTHTHAGITHTH